MTPQCGDCKFWQVFGKEEYEGHCKRYPPVLSPVVVERLIARSQGGEDDEIEMHQTIEVWYSPVTSCDDYCGEWVFSEKAYSEPTDADGAAS